MRALLLILLLAACGRPLTGPETDLAQRLFGQTLDVAPVRLVENGFVGLTSRTFAARPRTTCRERLLPPPAGPTETGRTAGVALGNSIHIRPRIFRPDFARNPDGSVTLAAAMFLAHELTHTWQWQNRARTGFSPLRAASEHRGGADPYLFEVGGEARFLDHGFEQQASIVEEYVCCDTLDPQGARTGRLRALISQEIPLQSLAAGDVILPWEGVERRGICA